MKLITRFLMVLLLMTAVNSAQQIKLQWDEPADKAGIVGYNVYRSDQSGVYTSPALNAPTPIVSSTTFVDTTVQFFKNYFYVVRSVASDNKTESANSNEVAATPKVDVELPVAPTNFVVVSSSDCKTSTFTWRLPSNATASYFRASIDGVDIPGSYQDAFLLTAITLPIAAGKQVSAWVHSGNSSPISGPEGWGPGIGPSISMNYTCISAPTGLKVAIALPTASTFPLGPVPVRVQASGATKLDLRISNSSVVQSTTTSQVINYTFNPVKKGQHTITAVARNAAGKEAKATKTIRVR